jgi:transcription initiation factor IIE alpha subunit
MSEIERRFKDYATGTDNAGKPLLSFTDQASDHPQILPIPVNGQDERFINLNTQITQEIFTAHSIVSPMLFGIKDSTGLGNNADELRTSAELYQNLHIDPEQDILNDLFNEIINYNGIPKCLYIQKIEPVGKELSEAVVVSVMTQDEIREKIGLAPLEPGQRVQMDDQTDEMLFAQLEKTGFNANDYEVLDSVNSEITCLADAERFENELLSKHKFALERVLTDMEKAVLDMVVDNPSLPSNEIRKALEISIEDVNEIIQELQNIGALDVNFKPTQDAIDTIQKPDEEIFVAYKYVERPDALPLKGGKSRRFCRQMLAFADMGRLYTLDQLKLLRNDFNQTGLDIFTKRGGWYTYIWQQQVLRKKR